MFAEMVVFVAVAINVTVEIRLLSTFTFCKACLKPFPAIAAAIVELTETFINNKVPLFTFTLYLNITFYGASMHELPFTSRDCALIPSLRLCSQLGFYSTCDTTIFTNENRSLILCLFNKKKNTKLRVIIDLINF